MRKSSRKPRHISKAWMFRITERASKCWKIAIPSVSPSKATMLKNKYNFTQKTLSLKISGLFSPCRAHVVAKASGMILAISCNAPIYTISNKMFVVWFGQYLKDTADVTPISIRFQVNSMFFLVAFLAQVSFSFIAK